MNLLFTLCPSSCLFFFVLYFMYLVPVLVMLCLHKGRSGSSPCSSFQWSPFTVCQPKSLKKLPTCWTKLVKVIYFYLATQEVPVGTGGMAHVSAVSGRATFLLSSALLWSSFDWKYFACLTTCWWIFLCQVMCQELAEHSKLITCVHTVKEKQTARHQWYEEWDFISVARDCVVNESAQSAGNW